MKSATILTICLITYFQANSQIIAHSSISTLTAHAALENCNISHSISKMNLVTNGKEQGAAAVVTTPSANQTASINETSNIETGTLTAYPVPAVNNINFAFELTETAKVNVSVYNQMGQKVSDVYASNYDGGKDVQQIDLTNFSSGMYFISLTYTSNKDQQTHTITHKFQVVK